MSTTYRYRVLVDIYDGEDEDGEQRIIPFTVKTEAGSEDEAILKAESRAADSYGSDNVMGAYEVHRIGSVG